MRAGGRWLLPFYEQGRVSISAVVQAAKAGMHKGSRRGACAGSPGAGDVR